MSRHRSEPPQRVHVRLGRLAAAGASLAVTTVALLGGVGVIPFGAGNAAADEPLRGTALHHRASTPQVTVPTATPTPSQTPSPSPTPSITVPSSTALPAASGSGRRAVFSISRQRVWLVDARGKAFSTYLASGSLTDNLKPGSYHVFSRQRWAIGVDDSGKMEYFVAFAHGQEAAIGFHSIPTKNGKPLQTLAQLGTQQSHGCIRQKLSDAVRMWSFGQVGTVVVVVA